MEHLPEIIFQNLKDSILMILFSQSCWPTQNTSRTACCDVNKDYTVVATTRDDLLPLTNKENHRDQYSIFLDKILDFFTVVLSCLLFFLDFSFFFNGFIFFVTKYKVEKLNIPSWNFYTSVIVVFVTLKNGATCLCGTLTSQKVTIFTDQQTVQHGNFQMGCQ